MKKLKYLLLLLLLIPLNVKADVLSFKIQNRTNLPYDTYWSSKESYTYEYDQVEQSSQNRYIVLRTCSTDYLDYSITSNSAGKINNIGNSTATKKCTTNGSSGWYIDYYFYIESFYQTTGVYVNNFNLKVYNSRTYNVYQTLINLYSLPDLDTVPDYSNDLNNIQSGIDNTNKKLQENNEEIKKQTEEQKKTNDTLKSEDYDTPDFSDVELADDTPISDLVSMPLNLLNKFISGLSNTCTPYNLPFFNNTSLTLPCFDGSKYFGSNLWNTIGMFTSFFMIYEIGMLAVQAFNDFTSLRDTYDSLYSPKHAKPLGKHTSEVE